MTWLWYAADGFATPPESSPAPPSVDTTPVTRFTQYAQNAASAAFDWKYELLAADGTLLATTVAADAPEGSGVIHWAAEGGAVTFDIGSRSARLGSLVVVADHPDLIPTGPRSILAPEAGSRVRPSAGIWLDGVPIWWPQATLLIERSQRETLEGVTTVSLSMADATAAFDDVSLDRAIEWAADTPVETVVARLIGLVVPDALVAETGYTLAAGALAPGDEIGEAVTDMLGGCGHEMVADVYGRIVTRPVPDSGDTSDLDVWCYGQADGLAVGAFSSTLDRRTPRVIEVKAGSLRSTEPGLVRRVPDGDPASLTYSAGPGPVITESIAFERLRSVPQADAAGYAAHRLIGSGPGIVEFEAAPNPAMRPYDSMKVEDPATGTEHAYQVIGYSLPADLDGPMTVVGRRFWSPDAGKRPSIEILPGFTTSFADDFDRPDGDLQGSAWTELQWSWGIYRRTAVQRYASGWSLALVNQRMNSTDHAAEIEISNLPAGKQIGPVVRSTGEFSGYAALIDPSGLLVIESWINAGQDERLASVNTGASPVDRVLRIEAAGSTITVKLDGAVVAVVTDDRHLGDRVGMLADGAPESNAPAVRQFTAEEVSP